MNGYEQALVSAVSKITKSDAARAASDARWLLGMVMNAAPQLSGQREYKLFTSLLSCNGNRILAEAAKKPPAARDAEVERLVQRLQSDFLLDEASARRICALYLAGITGNGAGTAGSERRVEKPAVRKPAPVMTKTAAPEPAPVRRAPAETEAAPNSTAATGGAGVKGVNGGRYKNRLLRFIPMAIAVLGSLFVFAPAAIEMDVDFSPFDNVSTVRLVLFLAIYFPAAIYCYIIAFPFDELLKYRTGRLRRALRVVTLVFGNLLGDIWIFITSFAFSIVFMPFDFTHAMRPDNGWLWIMFLGPALLFAYIVCSWIVVGIAVHAGPGIKEYKLPEYKCWDRELKLAAQVLLAFSGVMYSSLLVRWFVGVCIL